MDKDKDIFHCTCCQMKTRISQDTINTLFRYSDFGSGESWWYRRWYPKSVCVICPGILKELNRMDW